MLKAGFEPAPVLKEVGVRGKGDGPFPRITSWDPAGTWFEEPIIEGFALPRCPPWKDRSAFEQKALRLLASHLKAKVRPRAAVAYAMALSESVQAQALRMDARVAGDLARRLGPVLPVLASEAGLLAEVPLSETHGDFQPGNVLVENGTERVLLTDWEHAEERYAKYDFLVWGLRSRFAAGLSARLQAFLSRGALGPAAAYLPEIENAAWRRRALALFLLEELSWILRDGLSGPRAALSPTAHAIVDFAEARVFRR